METREEIKSRMLKDIAKAWGYQPSEMDPNNLDPLTRLILGACAVEFEKINQELSASRERILERLINTLTPGVLTGAKPAHAVLHVRPVEPELRILPVHQVYTKKKFDKEEKEIYFSAMDAYRLVDGAVRYIATGGKVLEVDNIPFREAVAQSESKTNGLPPNEVWLGLTLNANIQSLKNLAFFFNWKNEPKLQTWLQQLPFTNWYLGEQELDFEIGLRASTTPEGTQLKSPFEKEYSPFIHVKREIRQIYFSHFVSLGGFTSGKEVSIHANKQPYPREFEDIFPLEELSKMEDRLVWLRVEFPEYVPQTVLANMECFLNCFPVLNRRFYKSNYRLSDYLNILPLKYEGFFFDVERVCNEQEQDIVNTPLANIRNLEAGFYTLRNRSVGKMDYRAASQLLRHLLDVLRDDSAAFSAYHSDFLAQKIRKLNQDIADLEQHVKENGNMEEETPFIIVKPLKEDKNKVVTIEFWATNGEDANGVAAGANLEMYATKGFHRESIRLVTGTTGGRARKTSTESYYEFKKALVTRDRVVTKEDIKTFCFAHFGDRLDGVNVTKGFQISELPGEGMLRTVQVKLRPAAGSLHESEEWLASCMDLEKNLNSKATGLLPILVITEPA
jgi:hypothetical protein